MPSKVILKSESFELPQKCMMCLSDEFKVMMHNDDGNVIATTGGLTLAEIGYFPMHLCNVCRRRYRIPGVVATLTACFAAVIIMQIDGILDPIPEWISGTVFAILAVIASISFVIAMKNKPAKAQRRKDGTIAWKFKNEKYAEEFRMMNQGQVQS